MQIPNKKRLAVSPVIATLLLIAIAVAAAIIVYAFVTGLIGGLSSGANSNLITATASLVVPNGVSPGTLVISITNNANSPINSIVVTLGTAATGLKDVAAVPNLCMGENPNTGNVCSPVAAGVATAAMCVTPVAADAALFCDSSAVPIGPLPAQHTLAVGSQVSGTVGVQTGGSVLQSGSTYSFNVQVTFANGGSKIQVVSATAEL